MVREDIMGMLKTAIQKGKNIQQTIQSIYNSGYSKKEVDEAVDILNKFGFQQPVRVPPVAKQIPPPKIAQPKGETPQVVSSYPPAAQFQPYYMPQQFFPPQIVQRVSAYEPPKAQMGRIVTMIMVIMLIILFGILVTVFLFKEELTSFINNL